jgi:two-component system cell cycle response regulator
MEDLRKWYRGSLPASIDALKAARKAIPKSPTSLESIRRIAHTLQGSAVSYGFPSLGESARVVEQARAEDLAYCLDRLLSELVKITAALGPGDRPAILVIESDPQMARLLETLLTGADRQIVLAGSAAEALVLLEEKSFCLIVLELSLPDTDGRNFLVLLRERSATSGVPVIVLSGMGGPQPKTECFALGADAYFEKPIAPDVLKAAVSARLHKSIEYRREARQDALTGLPNRAAFVEGFRREAAQSARKQEPLSLALLDCDLLRRINDTLGHVAGDAALRHAARLFLGALRRSDLLARWGGDEFALLLPNTNLQGARFALEKVLGMLVGEPFRTQDGGPVPLSFSAGLVSVAPETGVEKAMAEADRCLYLAKTGGRARMVSEADRPGLSANRVLLAEDDETVAAVVTESLAREGFQVVHCRDGVSALHAALGNDFSLFILDLKREAIDGPGLLGELRRRSRGQQVPILMITSLGTDQEVVRGFQLGADDYLVKPFSPFDLMTRVHNLIRKMRA